MNKRKDWQEEVWKIKKEIADETRNMSIEEYWSYLQREANEFLRKIKRKKKSAFHKE